MEDGSTLFGRAQKVRGKVAAEGHDPMIAKSRQMATVPATRIEHDTPRNPDVSQKGADLAPSLVEAAVPVQPLVFRSEPGLEPVPGRRDQDRLAARPSVETTSRASAAEKPVGSQASA